MTMHKSKFIEWFNGKKTIIGAIVMVTITFLQQKEYIDDVTAVYLGALGTIIFGIGVGHKIIKNKAKQ